MDGIHLGAQGEQRNPMSTIQGGGEKMCSRACNVRGRDGKAQAGARVTEPCNMIAERNVRRSLMTGNAEFK